jgi:hypothetical protein
MEILMKRIYSLLMILCFVLKLFSQEGIVSLPYPVVISFIDEDGSIVDNENLYWEAWRSSLPNDVLNIQTSLNSNYFPDFDPSVGYLQIQCSDFATSLDAGDIVTVYIMNKTSGADVILDITVDYSNGSEVYPELLQLSTKYAPPPIVNPISPSDGAIVDKDVVFRWKHVERADGYKIYMGVSKDYLKMVGLVTDGNCYFKPEVHKETSYVWRVEAYNRNGDSVLAETRRITVN